MQKPFFKLFSYFCGFIFVGFFVSLFGFFFNVFLLNIKKRIFPLLLFLLSRMIYKLILLVFNEQYITENHGDREGRVWLFQGANWSC